MKALVLSADWKPKPGSTVTPEQEEARLAQGNLVWHNPTMAVGERPDPVISHEHEVLIRNRACGVCGSDIHMFRPDGDGYLDLPAKARAPIAIGHEYSGEVVEVGAAVTRVKPGDLVAVEAQVGLRPLPVLPARVGQQLRVHHRPRLRARRRHGDPVRRARAQLLAADRRRRALRRSHRVRRRGPRRADQRRLQRHRQPGRRLPPRRHRRRVRLRADRPRGRRARGRARGRARARRRADGAQAGARRRARCERVLRSALRRRRGVAAGADRRRRRGHGGRRQRRRPARAAHGPVVARDRRQDRVDRGQHAAGPAGHPGADVPLGVDALHARAPRRRLPRRHRAARRGPARPDADDHGPLRRSTTAWPLWSRPPRARTRRS